MTVARDYATATLLLDGRVLFAGGASGNPALPLASAELYDPRTGTFTATGSMTVDRDGAVAVLLQDGRVLVAGGWVNAGDNSETETASAELYDPQSGTFTATGAMSARGAVPTAVLLPDGHVLVIGGRVLPTALDGRDHSGALRPDEWDVHVSRRDGDAADKTRSHRAPRPPDPHCRRRDRP